MEIVLKSLCNGTNADTVEPPKMRKPWAAAHFTLMDKVVPVVPIWSNKWHFMLLNVINRSISCLISSQALSIQNKNNKYKTDNLHISTHTHKNQAITTATVTSSSSLLSLINISLLLLLLNWSGSVDDREEH